MGSIQQFANCVFLRKLLILTKKYKHPVWLNVVSENYLFISSLHFRGPNTNLLKTTKTNPSLIYWLHGGVFFVFFLTSLLKCNPHHKSYPLEVYNSVVVRTSLELCTYHHSLQFRTFLSSQKTTLLAVNLHSSL